MDVQSCAIQSLGRVVFFGTIVCKDSVNWPDYELHIVCLSMCVFSDGEIY